MIKIMLVMMFFALAGAGYAEAAEKQPLTRKERETALIAACASKGDIPGLKKSLADGLDAGLSVNEIKEMLVQVYAYCGFPRSLNALGAFMEVLQERGGKDRAGRESGPRPAGSSLEYGTANQTKLCGAPVKGALFDFAPAIDEYLKAHLFGDIFARDVLDWRTRELATIAMLAALPGAEPQLKAHIGIGKNNGLTDETIEAVLAAVRSAVRADAFALGDKLAENFSGDAWCAMLVNNKNYDASVYNVTFAAGTRNSWHAHDVGQILLCTQGEGYYQERGKNARRLRPGDIVEIPANTEHWHGAGPDAEFVHIGITPEMSKNAAKWLEPVSDADYRAAVAGAR